MKKGFTLVELLVVMAIIGILVTLVAGGFRTSQMRGRDAQRKSDLKNVSNSLELFLSDYGRYPDSSSGAVSACPYNPATQTGTNCVWGTSEVTDGKTIYFKTLAKDPTPAQNYYYRIVPGSGNQKFQIFAHLENTQDKDCLSGSCTAPTGIPAGVTCGASTCNFAVTSANTNYTE